MNMREFIIEVYESQENYTEKEISLEEARARDFDNVSEKTINNAKRYIHKEYNKVNTNEFNSLCVRETAKRTIECAKHLRVIKGILIAGAAYLIVKELIVLLIALSK